MPVEPIDPRTFRQVLGQFCTGITIITTMHDDLPNGFACQSFAALSLDPPLVLFCPQKTSGSWNRIKDSGRFCVNILGDDQEDVSRVFASKAEDKFAEIGWKRSGNGAPQITGVLAHIDCDIHEILDGGDHDIVLGKVTGLEVNHEGGPLVFFRGGYGRVSL